VHATRDDDARRDRGRVTASPSASTPLSVALATPADKQRYVRRLFHTIAGRYDLITVLLSFGRDAAWKKRLVQMAGAGAGTRALDLACGTGDIAYETARKGAHVVGLDVTERMIRLARAKHGAGDRVEFLVGDMMALPFPDASFDLVTTGYGIRNVPELEPALDEIARVLRPGGLFLSLDFNRPESAVFRALYIGYLHVVGGALGWVLHRDPDTYRYIPATIVRYPGAPRVVVLLRERGFRCAEWKRVLGGLMAIHVARKD
jgi:demethylmenaquinone methyltransferase/2-methoxy-6-polyprenyl-1,4-benzoquinol methylase